MRSWEGYDRRLGTGCGRLAGSAAMVSGHVLRLYTHEGSEGWSTARYRLRGKTLRIKWQGNPNWTVFKRV